MPRRIPRELPAALIHARDRFERWRQQRPLGTRIPQHLWDLAVHMARDHGLCRTSEVLKLDYYSLKKRLSCSPSDPPTAPAFVELTPALLNAPPECLLELATPQGAHLRLQLKGYHPHDLIALTDRLWKGQ
jgi:hypothetical protein